MTTKYIPTPSQLKELLAIKSGGGWKTTGVALMRKGWVKRTSDGKTNGGLYVTFAGLAAIRKARGEV